MHDNLPAYAKGVLGEAAVCDRLTDGGMELLERRFRSPFGEIDLIMKDGQTIVFVEVRYRQSSRFGGAAASVTLAKQQKFVPTAHLWLARHNGSFDTVDCRFDVVAFTGNAIDWLKNAFGEDA